MHACREERHARRPLVGRAEKKRKRVARHTEHSPASHPSHRRTRLDPPRHKKLMHTTAYPFTTHYKPHPSLTSPTAAAAATVRLGEAAPPPTPRKSSFSLARLRLVRCATAVRFIAEAPLLLLLPPGAVVLEPPPPRPAAGPHLAPLAAPPATALAEPESPFPRPDSPLPLPASPLPRAPTPWAEEGGFAAGAGGGGGGGAPLLPLLLLLLVPLASALPLPPAADEDDPLAAGAPPFEPPPPALPSCDRTNPPPLAEPLGEEEEEEEEDDDLLVSR